MSLRCAWCQQSMNDTVSDGPISHGCCSSCAKRLNAEMDLVEAGSVGVQLVESVIENTARERRIASHS